MKEFKGKVAVITGAASGIGYGLAERAAKEGMKVVMADVEEGALEKAEKDIKAMGAETLAVRTDVSKADDVKALAEKVIKNWGHGRISWQSESTTFTEDDLLHLDTSKALNKLKWQPRLDFNDAVSYTIDEYKVDGMKKEAIYAQRVEHITRYMGI